MPLFPAFICIVSLEIVIFPHESGPINLFGIWEIPRFEFSILVYSKGKESRILWVMNIIIIIRFVNTIVPVFRNAYRQYIRSPAWQHNVELGKMWKWIKKKRGHKTNNAFPGHTYNVHMRKYWGEHSFFDRYWC